MSTGGTFIPCPPPAVDAVRHRAVSATTRREVHLPHAVLAKRKSTAPAGRTTTTPEDADSASQQEEGGAAPRLLACDCVGLAGFSVEARSVDGGRQKRHAARPDQPEAEQHEQEQVGPGYRQETRRDFGSRADLRPWSRRHRRRGQVLLDEFLLHPRRLLLDPLILRWSLHGRRLLLALTAARVGGIAVAPACTDALVVVALVASIRIVHRLSGRVLVVGVTDTSRTGRPCSGRIVSDAVLRDPSVARVVERTRVLVCTTLGRVRPLVRVSAFFGRDVPGPSTKALDLISIGSRPGPGHAGAGGFGGRGDRRRFLRRRLRVLDRRRFLRRRLRARHRSALRSLD